MAELTRIVELLQEQRRALVDQLAKVDKAIAALHAADAIEDDADAVDEPGAAPARGDARHVKARRSQTDSHKHAIAIGKRKARNARDAAKGLMREVQDDGFVPAIRSRISSDAPRLVRRPVKKDE